MALTIKPGSLDHRILCVLVEETGPSGYEVVKGLRKRGWRGSHPYMALARLERAGMLWRAWARMSADDVRRLCPDMPVPPRRIHYYPTVSGVVFVGAHPRPTITRYDRFCAWLDRALGGEAP